MIDSCSRRAFVYDHASEFTRADVRSGVDVLGVGMSFDEIYAGVVS